jgi:hypothetical protein
MVFATTAGGPGPWMDPSCIQEPDRSGVVPLADGCRLAWWAFTPAGAAPRLGSSGCNESDSSDDSRGTGSKTGRRSNSGDGDPATYEGSAPALPPPPRLLVVWGAFATARHFDDVAAWLRDAGGMEVLLYHHRGVAE